MQAELSKDLICRYNEALWTHWDFALAYDLIAESIDS